MKEARLSHVLFCAVSAAVFALAAWQASTFKGTSIYFPEFAALLGLLLSLLAGVLGAIELWRNRNGAAAIDLGERGEIVAGLGWLGIWAGFVAAVVVLGFLLGSALWLGVWFRLVHRWRWLFLVPIILVTVAALWAAQTYGNVHLPGGEGLLLPMLR